MIVNTFAWSTSYFQLTINIHYRGSGGSFIHGGAYHIAQLMLSVCVWVGVYMCGVCSTFSQQLLYNFRILFWVKYLQLDIRNHEFSVFTSRT